MGYKRIKFEERGFDESAYKRYFHQNSSEYYRTRLRSIQQYHQGKDFDEIAVQLSIHPQSVRKYINMYIVGGFKGLLTSIVRPQRSHLNEAEAQSFKETLLSKRPFEVGLEGNIWTGKTMCKYLKNTYKVHYQSGIYNLLSRLNLSHQKAHADYGNANPSEQKAFLEDLKNTLLSSDEQTAILKFDEFSICEKPSSYYGWAEKNTRPKHVTNEKKESEPMAC